MENEKQMKKSRVEFNGKNKTIKLLDNNPINNEYIYSRWKEWVLEDLNAKYLPAFEVIDDEYVLINGWCYV